MKRVVVGLSGGVDSSVAALLLQQQGYEVIGIFMRNWNDESVIINDECPWIDDSQDANLVAESLGIPFHVIDFSADYKTRIVDYMFEEYQNGRTPNPDVLCNREVKFDLFLKAALQLDADFIATGHYCKKDEIEIKGKLYQRLLAGNDNNKDQSYFLCQVNQAQLSKALFPIGHLEKHEVREIARKAGFVTADKKDSQGLCFIGKVKLPDFLQQQLQPKEGNVYEFSSDYFQQFKDIEISDEATIIDLKYATKPYLLEPKHAILKGKHQGAHYFTIGQRKGLNIGGTPEPLFIIGTDTNLNDVYTGQGTNHPGLYRRGLFIEENNIHWIRPDLKMHLNELRTYQVKIRYRQELENCRLFKKEDGLYLIFDNKQRGIAAGQFAAWYQNNELVGSGVIN